MFYTNVTRMGNTILHRGVNNGVRFKKREKLSPDLYVIDQAGEHESIDGKKLSRIDFKDISDAREFVNQYSEMGDTFPIYGNQNWKAQFIQKQYPGHIDYDPSQVIVSFIDIEVDSSDGFPDPEVARWEVTAITVLDNIDDQYHTFGCKSYTPKSDDVTYIHCDNEMDLLEKFVAFYSNPIRCPDIITGWNSRFFDIPYLINRMNLLFGDDNTANKLSPWNRVNEIRVGKQKKLTYDILGISQLDYLEVFKKFTMNTLGVQESYKLDHIAHVVLGEKKIDYSEYSNLHTLYEKNYELFIDYNIVDTGLVKRLDDKLGLIELALTIAYKAGTNYIDVLGTTAVWDSLIYRDLSMKGKIVIPESVKPKVDYAGGFVKQPHRGMQEWVVSFDLNSMYPHLMMQYNLSPETIVPHRTSNVNVKTVLSGEAVNPYPEFTMACNGTHYRKDVRGIIPVMFEQLYDERKKLKKEMLSYESKLELIDRKTIDKQELYQIEKKISILNNQQMAIKILLNSAYGALGNRYFRWTNVAIAEAVTISGQTAIQWAERACNKFLNTIMNTTDVDYVIYCDTDSLYINFGPLIEMLGLDKKFANQPKEIVKIIDKMCHDQFLGMFRKSYDELALVTNAVSNRMVMEREVIAARGIWAAKKMYIINVHNSEGVEYDSPKLKMKGIDAVKSSTPNVCRKALKELFSVMMNSGSQIEAQKTIEKFRNEFFQMKPEEIAFPRGVKDIEKWIDKRHLYKSGTPIHVRASILYNNQLKKSGLSKTYEEIKSGEKIKFIYLKLPNSIKENVVGFVDYLPPELKLTKYVDYDIMFYKTYISSIENLFSSIGWTVFEQSSLEDFFV